MSLAEIIIDLFQNLTTTDSGDKMDLVCFSDLRAETLVCHFAVDRNSETRSNPILFYHPISNSRILTFKALNNLSEGLSFDFDLLLVVRKRTYQRGNPNDWHPS
jgi:hypothetical protein